MDNQLSEPEKSKGLPASILTTASLRKKAIGGLVVRMKGPDETKSESMATDYSIMLKLQTVIRTRG